jgi:PAS domain S-box-containing protein
MKKRESTPADAAALRARAEDRLKAKSSGAEAAGHDAAEDSQRLVHELEVHQIELELQNEELQESRAQLEVEAKVHSDLYDFAPMGYLSLDRDGVIRRANLTAARMLGLERARLVGAHFGLLVAPESRHSFSLLLGKLFESQAKQVCDAALWSEAGARSWVHIEAVAADERGRECRVVLVDIAERRRIEETLRFRMSLLEYAAEHSLPELLQKTLDMLGELTGSPIGFYHFVEPDQNTLSLAAWSTRTIKQFCTAKGQGSHYPIDQAGVWVDCVHERRPVIHNDYTSLPHRKGLPEGHAPITRELVVPIMRANLIVAIAGVGNKTSDYTDSDVKIVSHLADVAWNIVEHKRAEEALRQSGQRFKNLFQSMDEGFALCEMIYDQGGRPVDFRYLGVNAAFARLTGLAIDKVWGRTVKEVIPGIESHWIEGFAKVVESGVAARIENRVADLDKEYEVHVWRADPGRFAVVFSDVTERRFAEKLALESEQRALEAAEVLREADRNKNQFLAMLSHELRNPLAPITNSLYILDHATPGGEQARRALAVIGRQVGQLARLVDDLLDATRISRNKLTLQKRRFEINELVRRAIDDHGPEFEKNQVRIEFCPAPKPVVVNGDWNRLAQVVGNLLQNAAKFTEPGGQARVSVVTDSETKQAVVRVADTGVGLEQEMLARLFQPFVQADSTLDRSKGGLGLGLALVKGLVEIHGGSVTAHSAGLGRGAEFVVRLPLAPDDGAVDRPLRARTPAPGGRRRVLIIEDNIDAAESLREALEFGEHEVEVAYNGPTGIAKARELRPDVVFCDIGLPGMDGYGVARALRADAELKDVYLVALSGYASPEDVQRALQAGFDQHLAKPPNLESLEETLARVPAAAPEPPREANAREQEPEAAAE